MSRTVFILGAGASKQAGGPLMAEFLDVAENLRRSRKNEISAELFDLVFKGRASLQSVHSKSKLDLDNIESVFAAFEMAALFKRPLGDLSVEEVQNLPPATRRLIVETLEKEISFPFNGGRIMPPPPYHEFAALVKRIAAKDPTGVSLITFNYDLALDYALHFNGMRSNYCLNDDVQGIPFMKLHGSFNWTRCSNPECGAVVPWYLHEFFSMANWDTLGMAPGSMVKLNLTERIGDNLTHCGVPRISDPVIVPPTWNKTQYHRDIALVWQNAARHLSEAENIFVIGYSLPATDHFFQYLFALGTVGDALMKKFWVFDPDQNISINDGLEQRYKNLLGPMTLRKFQHLSLRFGDAIGYLEQNAGLI